MPDGVKNGVKSRGCPRESLYIKEIYKKDEIRYRNTIQSFMYLNIYLQNLAEPYEIRLHPLFDQNGK